MKNEGLTFMNLILVRRWLMTLMTHIIFSFVLCPYLYVICSIAAHSIADIPRTFLFNEMWVGWGVSILQ